MLTIGITLESIDRATKCGNKGGKLVVEWEVGGNYTLCGKAVGGAQLALVEITAIAKLMGH